MKFDAEAVQPDKLTLKWDAVSGAASYTVACWADGTVESKAALVEKIDGTACTLDKLTPETKYNAKVKADDERRADVEPRVYAFSSAQVQILLSSVTSDRAA